jgi:hypothetical protein
VARVLLGEDPCHGCHELVELVERTGLCRACLDAERARARAHGVEIPIVVQRTCTVTGCTGRHFGLGYCRLHYSRVYRTCSAA